MVADPLQPRLTDLLLYPTNRCNLQCVHCYTASVRDPRRMVAEGEVQTEYLCRVMDALIPFGLTRCMFSGGEPFLRPDLTFLCDYAASHELDVVIETNGTLIGDLEVTALAKLPRLALVSVSLDGARAVTHDKIRGARSAFASSVRAVGRLLEAKVNVQVVCCLMQDNAAEARTLIDLCAHWGVGQFKANIVMPMGRGAVLKPPDLGAMYQIDAKLCEHASKLGMQYVSSVPLAFQSSAQIMETCAWASKCKATSTLAVLADGTIALCAMGREVAALRFGNIWDDDLVELWKTHPTLRLLRESVPLKLRGVCSRCILRSACEGHCRVTGTDMSVSELADPCWQCAQMEARGLFPKNRLAWPS